jgi:hypothetical protein
MIKKILILIFLCLCFLHPCVSAQENLKVYIDHPFSRIVFEENNKISIIIRDLQFDTENNRMGIFNITKKFGVPFLNVTWNDGQKETFLILSNELVCFLYKAKEQKPYVSGFSGGHNRSEFVFLKPESIKASSSLAENGILYSPDQINSNLEQVWAEGKNGQGVNEKLFINPPYQSSIYGCTAIYISIGFVSYEKPYLYEENSRPKKINVSVTNKFSFVVDLLDTPSFQTIEFPNTLSTNDVLLIEILDVYHGTKYEDTCINNILYDTIPIDSRK